MRPSHRGRPAPRALRVARKPEPRAEGNGSGPFIFRRGPKGPLCIASQNKRPSPSSASLRPCAFRAAVQPPPPPPAKGLAIKAARDGPSLKAGHHHDEFSRSSRQRLRTGASQFTYRARHRRSRTLRPSSLPQASLIPARFPIRTLAPPPSPTSSTCSAGCFRIRGLSPILTIFSGIWPNSSTKRPPAFSACSTATKTGKGRASRNRTAPKCARSSLSA